MRRSGPIRGKEANPGFIGMRSAYAPLTPMWLMETLYNAAVDWTTDAMVEIQIEVQRKLGVVNPNLKLARPRPAGSPPRSPTGRLARSIVGQLAYNITDRAAFIQYNPASPNVSGADAGYMMFGRVGPAESIVGPAGSEHEFGQSSRGPAPPRRPFMGPALAEVGPPKSH